MKYLLFGTGNYYQRYKKWFEHENVVALIDNNKKIQNTYLDGKKIVSPNEAVKLEYDVIVVLSFYITEMKEQLISLGVKNEKIFHFYDLHKLLFSEDFSSKYLKKDQRYLKSTRDGKKKILLLSHDLELGGPALALYHVALVIKKRGYNVTVASMLDGELRPFLLDKNISVVIDCNLQVCTMKERAWVKNYDLILCNTINYHVFLTDRYLEVPVLWWLHDSDYFYNGIRSGVIENIDYSNVYMYSVGPVPKHAFLKRCPQLDVNYLNYAVKDIDDVCEIDKKENVDKICTVCIGYVEPRKGQDILCEAISKLPGEMQKKITNKYVGNNTSLLAQDLMEQNKNNDNVIFTGLVDRKGINQILRETDLLICPSREDPMPTVCAEAMMHKVPCLVSDATGTAEYLTNYKNGIIFESENVNDLTNKLIWCIEHKEMLPTIGHYAREIYENNFSEDILEKKVIAAIEQVFI